MSYSLRGFGDVVPVRSTLPTFSSSSVYVLRMAASGAAIDTPRAALEIVAAAGRNADLNFDVRGIGVWSPVDAAVPGPAGAAAEGSPTMVDVIVTFPEWSMRTPLVGDSGSDIAAKMQSDAALRATFPTLNLDAPSAIFGELTAPAQAVDFWRNQPVLWQSEHGLFGSSGLGGKTNAWAHPAPSSVVQGKADDGALATPWPAPDLPIVTPGGGASSESGTISGGMLVACGALVAALGIYLYGSRKGARS